MPEFLRKWTPPEGWLKIQTLDLHTAGEPLRVITGGLPDIPGRTILEKRRYFSEHFDHLRKILMWEPRGHADMYGAVLTPPVTPDGDFGVFFLHNEGYSTMCGHAMIALVRLALETGWIRKGDGDRIIRIDAPPGRIEAFGTIGDDGVLRSFFRNVPGFVLLSDQEIDIEGIGNVKFDIAYGGAFYAFVDAERLGFRMVPEEYAALIDAGRRIKRAVMARFPVVHPYEADLSFLYGTIFTGPPADPRNHSRNVCIFADGEVDRSPTGSGVSARAAIHHLRNEIKAGERITIESIIGSTMTVEVTETLTFGGYPAVIPLVSGTASFTGRHEFWVDPADPIRNGFFLR